MATDRGQRRLQLVADREQEGALGVLCLVELAREVVERARERRDLSGPGDGQRLGPLPRRKGTARLRDARDGSRDGAREEERHSGRESGADETGKPEAQGERRPVGRLARGRAEDDDRLVAASACGIEKLRPANADLAGRDAARFEAFPGGLGEQELGLLGREDREALVFGCEEASELGLDVTCGCLSSLGRDQVDLPLERAERGRLERAARQEGSGDDGHDERDDHRPRDADEEPRPQTHPTSL